MSERDQARRHRCDAHGNMEVAVREAAMLAARWRVPLHGVFLTDENVLRLAALPLSRHVRFSAPARVGGIAADELQSLLGALAAGMRRAIEDAARQEGVDWSFAELCDLPTTASGAAVEGDMLMVDAGMRPLSGSWRPRSPWEGAASELGNMVLLRRTEGQRRPAIVLVLAGGDEEHERTLAALRTLTGPRDRLHVVILGADGAAARAALSHQFERAGLANVALERVPDEALLRDFLNRLQPGLAAIETWALDRDELKAFVADTHCDLLLIGKA